MPHKIMIVAGEASADLHASNLVRELKTLEPGIEIYGVGGEKLKAAGANIWFDFSRASVVGLLEAVPKLKFYWDARNRLLESIAAEKPDLIVLMDLPGFNLHLSRKIKERYPGQKIVYYIVLIQKRGNVVIVLFLNGLETEITKCSRCNGK